LLLLLLLLILAVGLGDEGFPVVCALVGPLGGLGCVTPAHIWKVAGWQDVSSSEGAVAGIMCEQV
jgi:hypothetical protein